MTRKTLNHRWAAIFDWDGVIVDSSAQHERAWEKMAAAENRPLPPGFFRRSFGMKNDCVIPDLLGWTRDPSEIARISLRKEAMFRELVQEAGAELLEGVADLLAALAESGVPCAIGSSAPRLNIEFLLDRLDLRRFFRAMVVAEDVTRGKPHPEVFLRAAESLGVPPRGCLVFEDAHAGIEAALAAGMRVVAVATTHPPDSLRKAHRVVNRLSEVRVSELRDWFAAT